MPVMHKLVHSAEKAVEVHWCAPIRLQLPTYLVKPSLPHSGALNITHYALSWELLHTGGAAPHSWFVCSPLLQVRFPNPLAIGSWGTWLPCCHKLPQLISLLVDLLLIASSRFATKAFVVTGHKNWTSRCRDISNTNPSTEYKVRVAGSHNSNDGKTKPRWFCCFFSGLKFSHLLFRAGLAELLLSKLVPQCKVLFDSHARNYQGKESLYTYF